MSFVYFITDGAGHFKIGLSANPQSRLATLQTGCAHRLELIAVVEGGAALEAHLHARFCMWHHHGEWFLDCAEARDEIAAVVASPPIAEAHEPKPRRIKGEENIAIYVAISRYLRTRHPISTAAAVGAKIGVGSATVQKWLEGSSLPCAEMIVRLTDAYGPTFLAATVENPPDWLLRAIKREQRQSIKERVAMLRAELEMLDAEEAQV